MVGTLRPTFSSLELICNPAVLAALDEKGMTKRPATTI
jgi:hypothetical protein